MVIRDAMANAMPERMSTTQKLLTVIGLIVFAAVLLLAFRAYLTPSMLFDFASLQLCS
jgi:hypothetical protein